MPLSLLVIFSRRRQCYGQWHDINAFLAQFAHLIVRRSAAYLALRRFPIMDLTRFLGKLRADVAYWTCSGVGSAESARGDRSLAPVLTYDAEGTLTIWLSPHSGQAIASLPSCCS
jgi:hypothetical protein